MGSLRRRPLIGMGLALAGASAAPLSMGARALTSGTDSDPDDGTEFWARIARDYVVREDIVNLENGNWGIMSKPVLETYLEHTRRVNRDNSYFARRSFYGEFLSVRERVASFLGAGVDEIVFTRNATEALKALIGGYRGLTADHAVMVADLDYGSMRDAMRSRAARDGCAVIDVSVPEGAGYDELIEFYRKQLQLHPTVKLLLLTHVSHRTGLMLPVREIVNLARERGVDVIVDAAHSWGQVPFSVDDLGADFVGFNLHKWIGAPLGVGLVYIRRSRLKQIVPDIAARDDEQEATRGRVHTGTTDFAALLSVPAALDYHQKIGPRQKTARLRQLRNRWVSALRDHERWEILTPDDPRLYAGITSLRHRELRSAEDNRQLASWLLAEHRVFTVHRDGVAAGACVRITPSVYNSLGDIDRLVAGLRDFEERWKSS